MGWLKNLFGTKNKNQFSNFNIDELSDSDYSALNEHMLVAFRKKTRGVVKYVSVSFALLPFVIDRVIKLSNVTGESRSKIVRAALNYALQHFEDHPELISMFDKDPE